MSGCLWRLIPNVGSNAPLLIGRQFLENSQELPSLPQAQEAPEGLVCQEVQQVQQYQLAPSHQETPRKVQCHRASEYKYK